jgi:GTP cyclohydrolase I
MVEEKRYLVDVGIRDLPFPMRVASKADPKGQFTVANISISARITQEFEAQWINKFVRILHQHQDGLGTRTLRENIKDYMEELRASMVKIELNYPFFIEKVTPVSKEKCLVRYMCTYSSKFSSTLNKAKSSFQMEIPCITTYPASSHEKPGGLFGQLSIVHIEVETNKQIFPEDLVEIVDRYALAPVYSYLAEEDQEFIIQKVHSHKKTSVVVTDEVKEELGLNPDIAWYAVRCSNFGMLRPYSTVLATEKSMWVPSSGWDQ